MSDCVNANGPSRHKWHGQQVNQPLAIYDSLLGRLSGSDYRYLGLLKLLFVSGNPEQQRSMKTEIFKFLPGYWQLLNVHWLAIPPNASLNELMRIC